MPKLSENCHRVDCLCEVGDEEMDPINGCRYWIDCLDVGNCVMRNVVEHTLEEVGVMLDISKERARQLEERAYAKIRAKIIAMREKGETDL